MADTVQLGLRDQVVIITGAARGIGAACAQRFAREGAHLILADVDEAIGKATAQALRAEFVRCDVAQNLMSRRS